MAHRIALVFLFVAICSTTLGQKLCGKNPLQDIDELISNMMPFENPKMKAPTKLEELPQFCSFFGKTLQKIENVNKKCVKGSYKSMINVVVFNVKRHTKEVCAKKSLESKEMSPKVAKFFTLGKCIDSGSDKLKKCAANTKDHVLGIQNADKAKKLPLLCCELVQTKKCIFDTLTQQPGCNTPEAAEQIKNTIDNFGASAINSACGDLNSEDKCKGMVPPKMKKSQRASKSFLVPILHIISSI